MQHIISMGDTTGKGNSPVAHELLRDTESFNQIRDLGKIREGNAGLTGEDDSEEAQRG